MLRNLSALKYAAAAAVLAVGFTVAMLIRQALLYPCEHGDCIDECGRPGWCDANSTTSSATGVYAAPPSVASALGARVIKSNGVWSGPSGKTLRPPSPHRWNGVNDRRGRAVGGRERGGVHEERHGVQRRLRERAAGTMQLVRGLVTEALVGEAVRAHATDRGGGVF